ncbi:DUF961 family protein [Listeria monocytogenes]|uniref:DUF961 family protein n=1 Tax=Listeria monocytogenes TaxID=1639 RepID=UPI001E40B091|nr:DUF961 family protein [Listeria monocytogenes]EJQ3348392.1 DUF961 family protein [Listeria monocytogenes]EJS5844717.1 DUF961 family protein [Listeria monocytogenes]EJS5944992.1 DUF961 family protein [Listeria monocytogenes]EJS6009459.1 DUF961 family protein [Listeria monocytogenes]EJS6022123.1 DUF961 family protein [Listeria monocytogenes]
MKFSEKNMIIDAVKTFGRIGFIGYDGERFDSVDNDKVVNKRYGISSDTQEGTVMVYLPATVDVDFPFDTEVELVNPTINAFATATYNSTDIVTQVFADNIVQVSTSTNPNNKTVDKDLQKK